MTKIHLLFVVIFVVLAMITSVRAFAEVKTVVSPDGTITVCTVQKDLVICS
jgi:hypothetical protein